MKPKGRLTVIGTIDVRQFWPVTKGGRSSDGDTIHLKVDPNTSFLFSASPKTKPKIITTYVGAYVIDGTKKVKNKTVPKKVNVITSSDEIKIRLQGIDTPELHYPVIGKRHKSKKGLPSEFRQPFGAGAASALHGHLQGLVAPGDGTLLHATFVTQIDGLRNAVDVHGRFVGDILIGTAGAASINRWLVTEGWAYPLFYDSMTRAEVQTLLDAWKVGQKRAGRPGKRLAKPLLPFDPNRQVSNAKLPDGGRVNYPKIFRRQATFWTQVPGDLTNAEFVTKLNKGLAKKADTAFETKYFLANVDKKLNPKKRVKLATKIGKQGQTNFDPGGLVFKEDQTTLFKANGQKVTS